ncbi:MAG TPA: hypothetical protein VE961_21800 [Pyrinomonadaceae bacterium]|nr:hypothetical protein [Pyrinomonadaceae bacterium]
MTKQNISKFLLVSAMGMLVLFFGVILLLLANSQPISPTGPGIGGFSFAISRRAFTGGALIFVAIFSAATLLITRAVRRRH